MDINLEEVVTIDFETYYDSKYSLRAKVFNTSSYIMDEQFQIHCCAIKMGTKPSKCYWGQEAIDQLKAIDWSKHDMLAHNNFFDGFIAAMRLGIKPRRRFCTVQMTRGLHSDMSRASLQSICEFYGVKGKIEGLEDVKGLRTEQIVGPRKTKLMKYCNNDNEKCFQVFKKQIKVYPEREIRLIDLTLSMFCDPIFVLDVPRAEKSLAYETQERLKFIAISGQDEKTLKSTDKFVAALEALGVKAPTKTSKYNGEVTYALSETDEEFVALQDHEDIRVVRLVQGRLAAKSTMMETRAWRMLQAQETCGSLPVLLNYYGARTGRWSGGNKMNFQNLPTSTKDYPMAGELRKAIMAPPGHVIIAPDSSQIEARVLGWLSGNEDILNRFRNKEDVYKWMASLIYNVPIEEVTSEQRFIGKIAVLGLGYGMGAKRFQTTLSLGVMGPPTKLSLAECTKIVKMFRRINACVKAFWDECEDILERMCRGESGSFGPDGAIEFDGTDVWLPNGMGLHYPGLHMKYNQNGQRSGFRYSSDGKEKNIYGGLFTENLVQALAGVVIRDQMLDIHDYYQTVKLRKGERLKIATMTHDEVVSVVPERLAAKCEQANLKIMKTAPWWAPTCPISAESAGWAKNYSI